MHNSQISFASTPCLLWDAYVEYLWNYQPGSWVGRTASSFRILAVLLVLPVVILTLLDVTSYVIARTLGIVDNVKASTSDNTDEVSSILVHDTTPAKSSEGLTPEDDRPVCHQEHGAEGPLRSQPLDDMKPEAFFAGDEDLQLSGVGVFSPAASQPPSPVLPRMKLSTLDSGVVRVSDVIDGSQDEGIFLRRRAQGAQGADQVMLNSSSRNDS